MKSRRLIKSQIIDAWVDSIQTDYVNQRINSERSLQASFWAQLNSRLTSTRRLFIEPLVTVRYDQAIKKVVVPDIVVCNMREVIAVIELKYLPRAMPQYRKDIRTLDFISRNRDGIEISNERFRGNAVDSKRYTLSNRILFVWAGVHAATGDSDELFADGYDSLSGCYLQLHAATDKQQEPDIYYYSS